MKATVAKVLPRTKHSSPASTCAAPPKASAMASTMGSPSLAMMPALIRLSSQVVLAKAMRPSGAGLANLLSIRASSVKIPRGQIQFTGECSAIDEPTRHQVQHYTLTLQSPLHLQQRCIHQRTAEALGDIPPDDEIELSGLILQRHERHATGAGGPLPHQHQSCGT